MGRLQLIKMVILPKLIYKFKANFLFLKRETEGLRGSVHASDHIPGYSSENPLPGLLSIDLLTFSTVLMACCFITNTDGSIWLEDINYWVTNTDLGMESQIILWNNFSFCQKC